MQDYLHSPIFVSKIKQIFEYEKCPSCDSNSTTDLDSSLKICQKCDTPFGFDDSMSSYDFKDFFEETSIIEFQKDMAARAYTVDINCLKCGNSNPDDIILRQKDNTQEFVFFCNVCQTDLQSKENLNLDTKQSKRKCFCDIDLDYFIWDFNEDGNFCNGICRICKREIIPDPSSPRSIESINTTIVKSSYSARIKIDSIELLTPGCHISWHQPFSYWHHAIVTKVILNKKQIEIIHFSGPNFPYEGIITKEVIDVNFKQCQIYRYDYVDQIYKPHEVVNRAHEKIGETNYNLFKNNSEHFVNWCKIGINQSEHAESFVRTMATKFKYKKKFHKTRSQLLSRKLFESKHVSESPSKNVDRSNKYIIGAVIVKETVDTIQEIKRVRNGYKSGEVNKKDSIKLTFQRVLLTVGKVIGATLDFIFPIIQETIGSSLSDLIGKGIGCLVGKQLGITY